MKFKFANRFPVLETNRLILRQLKDEDAEFIHFIRNDERVNALLDRPGSENLDHATMFIRERNQDFFYKRGIYWGIESKSIGFLVGTITLWHLNFEDKSGEIGYDLHPDFHRRGLMSEAIEKVLDFAINMLDLKTITGICSPQNEPSISILKKFGFLPMEKSELSELDQEAGLLGFKMQV